MSTLILTILLGVVVPMGAIFGGLAWVVWMDRKERKYQERRARRRQQREEQRRVDEP